MLGNTTVCVGSSHHLYARLPRWCAIQRLWVVIEAAAGLANPYEFAALDVRQFPGEVVFWEGRAGVAGFRWVRRRDSHGGRAVTAGLRALRRIGGNGCAAVGRWWS